MANRSALVRTQGPVRLGPHSEPEPDIALLKRHVDRYVNSHPTADDVLLIIEVSDTTLRFDREVKARLYALHRIPEYWVIDLTNDRLHVHRDPRQGRYAIETSVSDGKLWVSSLQTELEVADLFP